MVTVAILVVLALLFGGAGLLIEGLRWALIIGVVLLLVGAVTGFRARSRPGASPGGIHSAA